jgi:hypothetical protein
VECVRQFEQALYELVHPGLGYFRREGERKECSDRIAAHSGDVAEAAGKAAVANGIGGMPLASEMNPFQTEIGSNQHLVTIGDIQDRAIIPNASSYPWSSGSPPADARNQRFFGEGHDGSNIQARVSQTGNPAQASTVGAVGATGAGEDPSN